LWLAGATASTWRLIMLNCDRSSAAWADLVAAVWCVLRPVVVLELVRSKELHRNRNLHDDVCGRACATNHHGT